VAKRLARHFAFERSRVLTPVWPDQVWVFFKSFPTPSHRGMSHISDKANAGSGSTSHYLPPSFRTHPHRTHPEFSRQCDWKGSGKPQQPRPPSGGIKDVFSLFIIFLLVRWIHKCTMVTVRKDSKSWTVNFDRELKFFVIVIRWVYFRKMEYFVATIFRTWVEVGCSQT
jgi:hypothetical protein